MRFVSLISDFTYVTQHSTNDKQRVYVSIRIIPMHFSCSLSKPTFQITNSIWNGSNGNSITTLFYTILQSAISNGKIYGVKETRCMHMDKIITIRTFYMKQNV